MVRLPSVALGIRIALGLLLIQPRSQRWLLWPGRSNTQWSPGTYVLGHSDAGGNEELFGFGIAEHWWLIKIVEKQR